MAEGPNSLDGPQAERDAAASGAAPVARRGLMSPGEALQPEAVPPPPPGSRRPRPILATVSGILSFLGVAAVAGVVLVSLAIQRLDAPGPLPSDKVVIVAPGSQVGDVSAQLESEGVIDNGTLMTGAVYAQGDRDKIKAGEYLFKQNVSLRDVIEELVTGRQILHAITLPEGLTSEQICDRLRAEDVLSGDIRAVPKEGTLMPDTFKVARGTTREQILRSMAQEQRKVVADVWSHRAPDTTIRSPYDMVTLASIVEKETGKADERPRVAGVFVNRLTKGIPLQSDPTIVYGLVGGKATLGRGILKSEIEQKTPYNTYAVSGLPPGPICNPGRAAMEAVANPSRTRDIFFVADGTGGHAFAETLDQHRQNVQRWRALEKDAKDKAAPDAGTAAPAGSIVGPGQPAVPGLPAVAAPKQRGDASPSVPVYGALSGRFEPAAGGPQPRSLPSLMAGMTQLPLPFELSPGGEAASRFAGPTPDQTASLDPDGPGDPALAPADSAAFFGVASAEPAGGGSGLSFPVSAAQRADERARAARYGAAAVPDAPPRSAELASADQGAPLAANGASPGNPSAGLSAGLQGAAPVRHTITDASEGTALDPLRDHGYDLMSAKTVPAAMSAAYAPRPNPYGPRPTAAVASAGSAAAARPASRLAVPSKALARSKAPRAAPADAATASAASADAPEPAADAAR